MAVGLVFQNEGLSFLGLMALGWLLAAWVRTRLSVAGFPAIASFTRTISDRGGKVRMLRAGRPVRVSIKLRHNGWLSWPLVRMEDRIPTDGVWHEAPAHSGWWPGVDGSLARNQDITAEWTLDFPLTGIARFEGMRLTVMDRLGLVASVLFLRDGTELLVLPSGTVGNEPIIGLKRANLMPPPGGHRHRRAGGSSELLDIRDYREGDSPKWIAWKLSARRGRVLVKEFENEVPIRCQIIVDATGPVHRWKQGGSSLCRLAMAAAEIIDSCEELRDPVGMILANERDAVVDRPNRGNRHRLRLLQRLSREAARPADVPPLEEDPQPLFEPARNLALELYPELYGSSEVLLGWNRLLLGPGRPGFSRYGGWTGWLFRHRGYVWCAPPVMLTLAYVFASPWMCFTATWSGPVLWVLLRLITPHHTLRLRERKRLGSVLAARAGGDPALLDAYLEDDTLLATRLRSFLAEHRRDRNLPVANPPQLTTVSRARAERIAKATRAAVASAQDPECHFLLTDTSDMSDRHDVLLAAARLVRSRRHHMIMVLDGNISDIGVSELVTVLSRLGVPTLLTRSSLAPGEVGRLVASVRRLAGRIG
jgi:uncharacterized protein (DUF58 family)